jgi:hypothetical protein
LYAYLKDHSTHNWVHWNMRNANYGFEAIANRFRILGGKPFDIEDQFKFDLSEVLKLVHTDNFEEHKPSGKLLNLANRNTISLHDAKSGQDESVAFDKRDFLTLHMSTSRKVDIVDSILTLEEKNQLKVNTSIIKECGLSMPGIIEIVRNNWLLFALWSVVMAILGAAMEPIFQHFFGTDRIGN